MHELDAITIKDDHLRAALCGEEFLLIDGAMGTQIQKRGLEGVEACSELLCKTHANDIAAIHRAYVDAGAEVVTTNTFSAHQSEKKGLISIDDSFAYAAACARSAGARYIAGDIGPTGELLQPMGTFPFEEAYETFERQARAAENAGCDLILIETMADLREAKAAVLAARSAAHLPVFVTMTFGKHGRTFLGTPPDAAAETLSRLGAHAVGLNCSLGPAELADVARAMANRAHCPLIAQPNAGLPRIEGERIFYDITPDQFACAMKALVENGANIIGGCCGTAPEYTAALAAMLKGFGKPAPRTCAEGSALASYQKILTVAGDAGRVAIIGTRINAERNDEVADAIADCDYDLIADEAIDQEDEEADAIAVNVSCDEAEQPCALEKSVDAVSQAVSAPVVIESEDLAAIEAAVRPYSGKALIKVAPACAADTRAVALLAKKYGCMVALGANADGAVSSEAATNLVEAARAAGLEAADIVVDCTAGRSALSKSEIGRIAALVDYVKGKLGVRALVDAADARFADESVLPNGTTPLAALLEHGVDIVMVDTASSAHMDDIAAYRDAHEGF